MMKVYYLVSFLFVQMLLIWDNTCFSQRVPYNDINIKELKIGDSVPDFRLRIINSDDTLARISDFRGKLLILDFWATYCKPCIGQFPKLDTLQKIFGDKIQILPVTCYKDIDHNREFFKSARKNGRPVNLPSVVEADSIFKSFPTSSIPHEIWINSNGIVVAITSHLAVTEERINKMLHGDRSGMVDKKYIPNDFTKPVTSRGEVDSDSSVIFRSMLFRYKEGLQLSETRYEGEEYNLITCGNRTPIELLHWAYQGAGLLPEELYHRKRVFVEPSSPLYKHRRPDNKISYEEYQKFQKSYLYNYQLTLPPELTLSEGFKIAVNELSSLFHSRIAIEKKIVKCYLVIGLKNLKASKGLERRIEMSTDGGAYKFDNISVDDFVNILNRNFPGLFINKTSNQGLVDVKFQLTKSTDIGELRNKLFDNGFELRESNEELIMAVIK